MYGIYANIGGILMVNVTIYSIHGSYGYTGIILQSDMPDWDVDCSSLTRPQNRQLHLQAARTGTQLT